MVPLAISIAAVVVGVAVLVDHFNLLTKAVDGAGNAILTIASLATYITSSSGSIMLDIKDTADTVAFNILGHAGSLYGDATHFYTGLAFKKVGDT